MCNSRTRCALSASTYAWDAPFVPVTVSSHWNAELERSLDQAAIVDMDAVRGGIAWQARHGHDRAAQRNDEAGAGREAHVADGQGEVLRRTDEIGIGGEAVLRLGHADRQVAVTVHLELRQLALGFGGDGNVPGAVDLARDGEDLAFQRR